MEERWPWEAEGSLEASDPLAHQRHEEALKETLPRVVKLLARARYSDGKQQPASDRGYRLLRHLETSAAL